LHKIAILAVCWPTEKLGNKLLRGLDYEHSGWSLIKLESALNLGPLLQVILCGALTGQFTSVTIVCIQCSEILENYSRSPFLAADNDNFPDSREREHPGFFPPGIHNIYYIRKEQANLLP